MFYRWIHQIFLLACLFMGASAFGMDNGRPWEGTLPDPKRARTVISIHKEFSGIERNAARGANRTSPLLRLTPDLLGLVMHGNAKVQRNFYQGCRFLSMLVQDFNHPGVDGGSLIARIPVRLHDDTSYNDKDEEYWAQRQYRGKTVSMLSQSLSLTESRFALRNVHITLETSHVYLTPIAAAVFQKILATNPHIHGIDYHLINNINDDRFNIHDYKRIVGSSVWPQVFKPNYSNLRSLCVREYVCLTLLENGRNLLFSFFPDPRELANLEEISFKGAEIDDITEENYGWLVGLTKLRSFSFEQEDLVLDESSREANTRVDMSFTGFTQLRNLAFVNASLSPGTYQSLSALNRLESLSIGEECILQPGDTPFTFEHLAGLTLQQFEIDTPSASVLLSTLPPLNTLTQMHLQGDWIKASTSGLGDLSRLPNLFKLTTSPQVDFSQVAKLHSLRSLILAFYDNISVERYRPNFAHITSLVSLENITLTTGSTDVKFEEFIVPTQFMNPAVLNALPRLTSLILDINAEHVLIPTFPEPLKPSIQLILDRPGNLGFYNLPIA